MIIQDFLWIRESNINKCFIKSNNIWNEANSNYFSGCVNNYLDSHEGIEIYLNDNKNKSYIKLDSFATTPCFKYSVDGLLAYTTDLSYFFEYFKILPEYNIESLKQYFALGYNAIDQLTIYNNITFLAPGSLILLNESSLEIENIDLFGSVNPEVTHLDVVESLVSSVKQKFHNVNLNEVVFLMTGGKDSLLGSLLVKAAIGTVDTATFGFYNSKDRSLAKKRHDIIFPSSSHYSFDISEFNISEQSIKSYVKSLFGYGPFSSIYYDEFLKKLSQKGKKYVIFSDHFECTRKIIKDSEHFISNYTTPKGVVSDYFSVSYNYENCIKGIINGIHDKYLKDPFYEFYFFNRYNRASYYKNVLTRKWGMTKITLVNDPKFLTLNHSFIRTNNKFTYDLIIQYLLEVNMLNSAKEELQYNQTSLDASIPILPVELLMAQSKEFILLLLQNEGKYISHLFNFQKMIHDLSTSNIKEEAVWFFLRLFQILKANSFFREKILICDIDNTVADQYHRIEDCLDLNGNLDQLKAYSASMVEKDRVLPGAVEAIRKFKHCGYKIIWLSARQKYLQDVTYLWLTKNGFPVDELIIVEKIKDKIPIIERLKPTLVIDDCKYNQHNLDPKLATDFISSLQELNVDLHIFNNDWEFVEKKLL